MTIFTKKWTSSRDENGLKTDGKHFSRIRTMDTKMGSDIIEYENSANTKTNIYWNIKYPQTDVPNYFRKYNNR